MNIKPVNLINEQAAVRLVLAMGAAQDRMRAADSPPSVLWPPTPPPAREHYARKDAEYNAKAQHGILPQELGDWRLIRAKGYSAAEAADIIIRSRRS